MTNPQKQPEIAPRWRDVLPIHPAADLFPRLSQDELRELADDIKKNGLLEHVVLYDELEPGMGRRISVLEGINRLDALELIGREIVDVNGNPTSPIFTKQQARRNFDPYAFVISKNIVRRHLTPAQKDDLIAKLLKLDPTKSNRQVATELKVDHKKVAKVRAEKESTGEISPVDKTKGKDGKERPTRKSQASFDSPQEAHAKSKPPTERFKKENFKALSRSWLEVHAQISAGNLSRLKDALENHREIISKILDSGMF